MPVKFNVFSWLILTTNIKNEKNTFNLLKNDTCLAWKSEMRLMAFRRSSGSEIKMGKNLMKGTIKYYSWRETNYEQTMTGLLGNW